MLVEKEATFAIDNPVLLVGALTQHVRFVRYLECTQWYQCVRVCASLLTNKNCEVPGGGLRVSCAKLNGKFDHDVLEPKSPSSNIVPRSCWQSPAFETSKSVKSWARACVLLRATVSEKVIGHARYSNTRL